MRIALIIASIFFLSSCGIYGNERDIAGREGTNFICHPSGGNSNLNQNYFRHNAKYKDTPGIEGVLLTIYAPDTAKIHSYYKSYRKSFGVGKDTDYLFVDTTFNNAILKMKKFGRNDVLEWYKFGKWYFHRDAFWLVDQTSWQENQLAYEGLRFKCKTLTKTELENVVEYVKEQEADSIKYLKELEQLQEAQYKL
jgi:hypothetical protein